MKKISVIIPCYNEEETLPLFDREMAGIIEQMPDYEFEIFYVNDGSKDGTLSLLREYAKTRPYVRYASFSRNFGKEAGMYAGFCNVTGDYVTVMDADLQDPPSLLPEMVRILETEEYDSVATRRVTREGEPPIRSFFARLFYKIMNAFSDVDVVDGARDYRIMKREMVEAIVEMGEQNRFSKGIFGWIGFRTYWLPFENVQRQVGETKWSFWGLLKYSLEGIMSFSQVPLYIASWTGIGVMFLAFLYLIWIVIRRIFLGNPVAGWASETCIILFIGGIQLFCLGLLGQYVGKTYVEAKKRPHYIISEGSDDEIRRIG